MRVDLPAPLAPTRAIRSPRSMVKLRLSRIVLFAAGGRGVDLGEVLDLDDCAAGGRRLGDAEVDRRFFIGDLDALDLFELLDAGLDLLGLGGLGAEAVDEGFKSFDAVALVLVRRHELGTSLFFLGDVLLVVAVVGVHALVP